jgi:hypothetical protein
MLFGVTVILYFLKILSGSRNHILVQSVPWFVVRQQNRDIDHQYLDKLQ